MWIEKPYYYDNTEKDLEGIWTGHRERLRLRMEEKGFYGIKPHEQIEILLYYALPQKDLSDVARNIIARFDNIRGFIDADPDDIRAVPGMTPSISKWLLNVQELVRAYMAMKYDHFPAINNFRDSLNFIIPRKKAVHPPESWIVFMDFEHQIMMRHVITPSLSWAEPEYVRDIIRIASSINARYAVIVLFVGTLPPEPDEYEDEHLLPVALTLQSMDVELMDLIFVSESGYLSMNRAGLMDHVRAESQKLELHERYVEDGEDGLGDG